MSDNGFGAEEVEAVRVNFDQAQGGPHWNLSWLSCMIARHCCQALGTVEMPVSKTIETFTSAGLAVEKLEAQCIYCNLPLQLVQSEERTAGKGGASPLAGLLYEFAFREQWIQHQCPRCGWWTFRYHARKTDEDCDTAYSSCNAFGILERFNASGTDVPIGELQRVLLHKFDLRFDIHPRILEEVVADVFRCCGYQVELTSYSKDGGIDLYLLYSPESEPAAVQVKRNKRTRKIGISEIDTFLGTLLRNKIRKGIYVTTSDYTRGAKMAASAERLKEQAFYLDLWNCDKLFDALRANSSTRLTSAEVAWSLRDVMPIEHERLGDYGGEDPPIEERSIAHIDWWISKIGELSRGGALIETSSLLPIAASKERVLQWLNTYKDAPCELWFLRREHESGKRMYCEYGTIRNGKDHRGIYSDDMDNLFICRLKESDPDLANELERHRDHFDKDELWYVEMRPHYYRRIATDRIIKITNRSYSAREYLSKWRQPID